MNLNKAILDRDSTLVSAIKAIDVLSMRIAFICDESDKLIGILTDGDIRRHLINGGSLESSVSDVMNTNPIVANINSPRDSLKKIIQDNDLIGLPLVDDDNCLMGVETLNSLFYKHNVEADVLIMAGGFGSRLMPLTSECPKPMLKVGSKPLLEIIIDQFKNQGFKNFYISTHYLAEVIKDHFGDGSSYGISIKYIYEEKPLGTGGVLSLIKDNELSQNLILTNGDILTNLDFIRFLKSHISSKSDVTVCVKELEHFIPYGVISRKGNDFNIDEKPTIRYQINTGIYLLKTNILNNIKKKSIFDMPNFILDMNKAGKKIDTFSMHDLWMDIGQKEDLERARRHFENV